MLETSKHYVWSNYKSSKFHYHTLYNNQINVRALIGQPAVGYCAGKPTEKSHVFWIIIWKQ